MARILIAEDDATSRAYLSSLIAQLEHEVVEARDGDEALQQLKTSRCDLALVDLIMPKRSGLELLRALRADPQLRMLPVVVVTAMNRESDRPWALKQGADEFMLKPVSLEELRRVIERHLQSG